MVWYERAVFRSTSSYINMMNGVGDLGFDVDRLWRTGDRYADETTEAGEGMTSAEHVDMVNVYKNTACLFGFFNVTDRARRFDEYLSLRRPLMWYLVRVDLCTFFAWYNRQLLMHERWRFCGVVLRGFTVWRCPAGVSLDGMGGIMGVIVL